MSGSWTRAPQPNLSASGEFAAGIDSYSPFEKMNE